MNYVTFFDKLSLADINRVGGKNAALGEMIQQLAAQGITVPHGFAITADAYRSVLKHNNIHDTLKKIMVPVTTTSDLATLKDAGKAARACIESAQIPPDVIQDIKTAYDQLCAYYKTELCDVAVRSSATAEDLPEASFAGQQETFLNVRGHEQLLDAVKKCLASLFTDRAIIYRMDRDFDHFKVAISVGVQKMVRSDKACSGVAFSLDTESGFRDVVVINASWGLGETIVQGAVIPDEFYVHKPTLAQGFKPLVKKHRGAKLVKKVYSSTGVEQVAVPEHEQKILCLTDDEVLHLAQQVIIIEKHYTQVKGQWLGVDVEWAKDGDDGKIYIIQARPETVHSRTRITYLAYYHMSLSEQELEQRIITTGQSIGQKIVAGKARIILSVAQMHELQPGELLITRMTDPDWVPVMKKAAGIITTSGGRTCHAAIVSREMGIPALVGAQQAMELVQTGQSITLDCSRGKTGYIYDGEIPFEQKKIEIATMPQPPVQVMLNLAVPDRAYTLSVLPVAGVGLARIEFVIANKIKIHPMALAHPERVDDALRARMQEITYAYPNFKEFFVDRLSQEVGTIAAAFWPRPVFVRFSDFKSNEYRALLGGHYFEPVEENPMIGFRGALRYYHERYADAFALECAAIKRAREVMGFTNIALMIPFVRTVDEAHHVITVMKAHGLVRGDRDLKLLMMIEIPSDVLLFESFAPLFDGFSIGSNDLAQMTLSVDRNSELLASLFDERDPAVKKMFEMIMTQAKKHKKYMSICGQAPSDYPEIARLLIDLGIDAISLNADSVMPFLLSLGTMQSSRTGSRGRSS